MIKYLIAFAIFFPATPHAEPLPTEANYTFELAEKKSDVKSYIFGSTHASPSKSPVKLGECTKKIISKTNTIYIEADRHAILKLASSSMIIPMSRVAGEMTKPQIQSLSQIILGGDTPELISKLNNLDAIAVLNELRSQIPGQNEILGTLDYGLDTEIEIAAKLFNKHLQFIEVPEDQIYFFQRISPRDFSAAINEFVDMKSNANLAKLYLEKLLYSYRSAALGNEEGLANEKSSPSYLYQKGIGFDRNESLAEKIITILNKNKDTKFIALGAAHLAGEGSVIDRLRNAGIIIKRLCNNSKIPPKTLSKSAVPTQKSNYHRIFKIHEK